MKNGKGKYRVFLIFAILLALGSAGVTYIFVHNRQLDSRTIDEFALQTHLSEAKTSLKADGIGLAEALNGAEELYLESYHGPVDMIELEDQEGEALITYLKNIVLRKTNVPREEEKYTYVIHLKNQNLKLKVGTPYVYLEDMNGNWTAFQGEQEEMEELINRLETVYMDKYHQSDLFKEPKAIKVFAEDEAKQWDVDKKKMEEFIRQIILLTPMDQMEAMGVSAKYPDYSIVVDTNHQKYHIKLINEELLSIDSPNQFAYYKFDKKLWDYVVQNYPVQFKAQSSDLKRLLIASKVIVEDSNNQYDLEDESYYPKVLARTILRSSLKEAGYSEEPMPLNFTLTFTIEGKERIVKIYQDYLVFEGQYYHSPRIDEAIRSTMSVL